MPNRNRTLKESWQDKYNDITEVDFIKELSPLEINNETDLINTPLGDGG